MITLLQAVADKSAETLSFGELFMKGGWLMWPLLLLGGLTIYIFVERFVAIRKATKIDPNFMNRLRDLICDGKVDAALRLCKKNRYPHRTHDGEGYQPYR